MTDPTINHAQLRRNPMRHTTILKAALLLLTTLALPSRAFSQGGGMSMKAPATAKKLDDGKSILVDAKGMTLYTYGRDAAGKSSCNGGCATNWPPLKADAGAMDMGDWTVVTRDDGSKMWAYKTKPLYYYAKDAKAGDMTGDNMGNGNWKVAAP
jgi:predicted lipoprotein with Yx(FWY)xxD motif